MNSLYDFLTKLLQTVWTVGTNTITRQGRRSQPKSGASVTPSPDKSKTTVFTLGERLLSVREQLQSDQGTIPLSVVLTLEQRLRHQYVLGGTGSGKTNLLLQQLLADVAAGHGVCLLDARGDLLDRVLLRLAAEYSPAEFGDRLVLLDLRSHSVFGQPDEPVVGINLLSEAGGDPYTRALFVVDLLKSQFADGLGVQTEEILRNCLLALSMTGWSLLEVEPMLTMPAFRDLVLQGVTDAGVRRFFDRFNALADSQQVQWVSPVMNKLTPWLARPSLRHILGQRQHGLSFRRLFTDRPDAIVLICTARDELFAAADFLTHLLVSAVAGAVMRPERALAKEKPPVFLYLDEFENLAEASKQFEAMVSEARRYGLGLLFAHQSTVQLPPKIRALIRNVVACQIFFSVGGLDADQIAGELPSEEPKAVLRTLLISQKTGEALVLLRGEPLQRILTRHQADPSIARETVAVLRQASLTHRGRSPADIERELADRETLYRTPLPVSAPPGMVSIPSAPVAEETDQGTPPSLEARDAAPPKRSRTKGKTK